jgi:phage shock protein PspC (stress-responsive transcriptional regulator)
MFPLMILINSMYMYTTSKVKHVKGVSLGIGGYLDWMKRSASFIYPVTTMASRSFVNGD